MTEITLCTHEGAGAGPGDAVSATILLGVQRLGDRGCELPW
jgi:hypothetical protein